MMPPVFIREIGASDDAVVARIIRTSLEDFGAVKPGTVYYDETTDRLHDVFLAPGSRYYVVLIDGEVVGGAGIYPTEGLPDGTCELVKMYVSAAARGKGLGKLLLEKCMEAARNEGYSKMYIETMPELTRAIAMYQQYGFHDIPGAMGNSGHSGCDLFMIKDL